MQASTVYPVTNFTTTAQNTTTTTKSPQQILIQNGGTWRFSGDTMGCKQGLSRAFACGKQGFICRHKACPVSPSLKACLGRKCRKYWISESCGRVEGLFNKSSGAIIAIIVIAIIIILAILLIILKTYNRRTHAARILTGSSNNQRKNTSAHSNMVMGNIRGNSGLGSFAQSTAPSENGFHLPRVDLGTVDHLGTVGQRPIEQFSTTSGSTVVTIHDTPSVGNT